MLVLTPFRLRFTLESRPVGNIYRDFTDFLLFGHDIALILVLLCWATAKLLIRQKIYVTPSLLTLFLIAFTIILGINTFVSVDRPLTLYHFLRALSLLGLYLFVIDRKYDVQKLIPAIAIQVAVQALVAIPQFLNQKDLGLQVLGEYRLNADWEGVSIVLVNGERWLRSYALTDHPNILGGSLAFALVLLIGHYLDIRKRAALWIPASITLGSLALFTSFSRSAWFALAASLLFVFFFAFSFWGRESIKRLAVLAVLAGIFLLPVVADNWPLVETRLPFGSKDFSPTEIQSIGERALLNSAATQIFIQSPIMGSGFATSPQVMRSLNAEFSTYYQPAHFVLLTAAAETGLLGSALYAVILFGPWLAFLTVRQSSNNYNFILVSSLMITITLVGFLDYYPWLLTPGRLWMYLIWGIWAVEYRRLRTSSNA